MFYFVTSFTLKITILKFLFKVFLEFENKNFQF